MRCYAVALSLKIGAHAMRATAATVPRPATPSQRHDFDSLSGISGAAPSPPLRPRRCAFPLRCGQPRLPCRGVRYSVAHPVAIRSAHHILSPNTLGDYVAEPGSDVRPGIQITGLRQTVLSAFPGTSVEIPPSDRPEWPLGRYDVLLKAIERPEIFRSRLSNDNGLHDMTTTP